jgi:hypothetical protein
MIESLPHAQERLKLGALICVHIAICCVSLIYVSDKQVLTRFDPATFHIFFDAARLQIAIPTVAIFSLGFFLFVIARFSFGYFVSFYFYTMTLGFLWLNSFTDLSYDHRSAELSASASAVAFLLPALFIASPVRPIFQLSSTGFNRLLTLILCLGVATVVAGTTYNFHIAAMEDMASLRANLEFPTPLRYLLGITSSALLPFAFAGFMARKAYWRAGAVLLLLICFYPITISKLALFTPLWLISVLLLSKFVGARIVVVLSLLLPLLAGLTLVILFGTAGAPYFSIVNFRMIAIPSVAMDVYNDFFSKHDLTYFCQVSFLKRMMHCPYQDQLSVVMERAYKIGNFNASLFATEGIASLGLRLAPVAAFFCGLVIALGNRLSAGLPTGFILVSGAVLPQVLLNVPLTTVLLTHGAALLFLLWYITPRVLFEQGSVVYAPVTGKK